MRTEGDLARVEFVRQWHSDAESGHAIDKALVDNSTFKNLTNLVVASGVCMSVCLHKQLWRV